MARLFEDFDNWLNDAEWRVTLFCTFLAAVSLVSILAIFTLTVCGGYWLGLVCAFLFKNGDTLAQGIPLMTNVDFATYLSTIFIVWCIIAYHQVINHPKVEVLEGGMLVERRTWPNHSLWFYLIFALLFPVIAGFVAVSM